MASRDDLIAHLDQYFGADRDQAALFCGVVSELSPDTDLLTGLDAVCRLLLANNPRFSSAIFIEWVLEDK